MTVPPLSLPPPGPAASRAAPLLAAMPPGGSVPVTLQFGDAGTLTANFAVRGAAAR
jgi:hypothetical protein